MLRRTVRLFKCGQSFCCTYGINAFHTNAVKVLCSARDKDLPFPHMPTAVSKALTHDTDILLEQIRKSKTLDRILELTNMHLEVMNSKHTVTCFENIHQILKSENTSVHQSLIENKMFQGLCIRLMRTVRFLEPQELISVYKCLVLLNIRNNTFVMQAVLKMIGTRLNEMNLNQLTFVNFLLSRQKHNPLVDGLRLALPLVLQVQIDQQLDSENMTEVTDCLQLACKSKLKPATIEKIVSTIIERSPVLTPDQAMTIIFSLLNLETPVDGYKELLNVSFGVLCKNIEILHLKEIIPVLRICRNQAFYHGPFFFCVADAIVANKWNLQSTYEIFIHFYKLSFCPSNLMDYLVDVICSEAENVRTTQDYSPLSIVEYLTATGYQPPRINEAVSILFSCSSRIEQLYENSPNLAVKFVSCLAILGQFPPDLLTRVLNENYLFNAWSLSKKQGRVAEFERSLFSIMWGLEVYDQNQQFSLPDSIVKKLTQGVYQRYADSECPLTKFIENGLGGSQFLLSGVYTRDGHVIDHIVAMRSGNYPISIQKSLSTIPEKHNQNMVFVEDIELPLDTKIVAIMVTYDEQYCRDPEVLRGWMDIKIRSLAKKDYSPVIIHYSRWRDLPDREKIPYLMREIKQAVQDKDALKTTSS
ncbi:FAST kinase domain-containing protein 2, partial [Stegodyphus mimosarum]